MKNNTFNILIQLYIEQILSGAKSYLASHPELGVPLGIFNYKHEPNYKARVKSIKKLGPKGNKLSLYLAKTLEIKYPLPSFNDDEDNGGVGPPPDCPPGSTWNGYWCEPIQPDDDDDAEIFALDRVAYAFTINGTEADSIEDLQPSQQFCVGNFITTTSTTSTGVYNYQRSVLRNWSVNNTLIATEENLTIGNSNYAASNYDVDAHIAIGNISFSSWLAGIVELPQGTGSPFTSWFIGSTAFGATDRKDVQVGGNSFYSINAPHRMKEFLLNSCLDSTISAYSNDGGDLSDFIQGAEEIVGPDVGFSTMNSPGGSGISDGSINTGPVGSGVSLPGGKPFSGDNVFNFVSGK